MKRCVDTTFLSDLVRGRPPAVDLLEKWIGDGDSLFTTSVNCYEVSLGIARVADARTRRMRLRAWEKLSQAFVCGGMTRFAADIAAARQAELMARGSAAPLMDLFIASIAFANDCELLVTNDMEAFARIGLVPVESHKT